MTTTMKWFGIVCCCFWWWCSCSASANNESQKIRNALFASTTASPSKSMSRTQFSRIGPGKIWDDSNWFWWLSVDWDFVSSDNDRSCLSNTIEQNPRPVGAKVVFVCIVRLASAAAAGKVFWKACWTSSRALVTVPRLENASNAEACFARPTRPKGYHAPRQ